jgi:hypothetical protein
MLEYQTMNHPHINPHENPANALFRLLQLLPPAGTTAITHHEAQLFEAICFQARRTQQAIAASLVPLQPLLTPSAEPDLATGLQQHVNLFNASLLLQHEADITHAIAEIYQLMLTRFYQAHPDLPQFAAPASAWPFAPSPAPASAPTHAPMQARNLIAQFDKHFYFPLGKLLQQLPGDITNVNRLTPEQGQMCLAVAQFAAQAVAILQNGLAALDTLLAQVGKAGELISNQPLRDLLAWCRAEAGFMQECGEDYRDAADNILRAV